MRSAGYYPPQYGFFWSYKLWVEGDAYFGKAIIANIAMFIPFGFFTAAISRALPRKLYPAVILLSFAFSALIETTQFFLMRGYLEIDDLFNNVLGAVLGALFFRLLKRMLPERSLQAALHIANAGIFICCLGVFCFIHDSGENDMTPLSQGLCFQVEEASELDGVTALSGVCFWYEREGLPCGVLLQSIRTRERIPLKTDSCLPRPDVSAYFHREGLKAGFHAEGPGIAENEEYEILLDFGCFRTIPTGVYLTFRRASGQEQARADIHYLPSAAFTPLKTAGTGLEEIVTKGVLRAYRPDFHVYVYSYEGSLYWIAENGFYFERDGSTFMNAVLWTTEPEKISERSKARGIPYDALGVDFEQGELTGNFGQYRVSAWKIPTDYPVTSVKTGYYRKGWVWESYFWPVFDFSSGETHAGS